MAVCNVCKGEMLKVQSCIKQPMMTREGRKWPIPFGKEEHRALYLQARFEHPKFTEEQVTEHVENFMRAFKIGKFMSKDERCHDCGVVQNGFHHPGCDTEECPVCHLQIISCDCLRVPAPTGTPTPKPTPTTRKKPVKKVR